MTSFTLPDGFANQQAIDEAYNPSLVAADPAAARLHFEQRSAEARASLPCLLDVPYGPTRAEVLDIFPATQAAAPVFVFVHGGYWRAGLARDYSCVAFGPQALGITTVVVNYALCPAVSIDEIVRQVRAAVAWVLRNIDVYGGDPTRVAIGGHSAGGQLGAMSLLTPWAEDYGLPADPLAGAVLVSGLYDLSPLRYSYLQPMIQLSEGSVARNSALHHVRSSATPLLLTWGGREQPAFAQQSQRFLAAWQQAGNVGEAVPQEHADHFSAIHAFEDPDSLLCTALRRMLRMA